MEEHSSIATAWANILSILGSPKINLEIGATTFVLRFLAFPNKGLSKIKLPARAEAEDKMKAVRIKTSEIMATDIKDIQTELEMSFANEIELLCQSKNWAKSDAIEAVAQHISATDTDFVFVTL